jgi:hypothetical protein
VARRSRLSLAKSSIVQTFQDNPQRVFKKKEVGTILQRHRDEWKLAASTTPSQFLAYLLEKTPMREVELKSESYGPITRYAWGTEVSPYELFLSIKKRAYLCHATAIFLHGLSDLIPKMIYVNAEQSPKPPSRGTLSQEALTRAFANKQRMSQFIYSADSHSATFLSGKNTGDLGVIEMEHEDAAAPIRVTDVERTLIDATVRPGYAGGVGNVLDAFREARPRVSVNRLRAYLKKIAYVYPYHQAIGFFMSRAGYPEKSLKIMRDLGLDYDFYLDYGIKRAEYDSDWRVHFPKGL